MGFRTDRTNADQSETCDGGQKRERRPEVVGGRFCHLKKENPGVFLFFVFLFFLNTREEERSDSNKSNIGMR